MRKIFILALIAASVCCQAQYISYGFNAGASTSNIALIQSVTGSSNSGTSYTVTTSALTSGSALIIIQNDADNPAAPSAPTGVGVSCVATPDFSFGFASTGRITVWNCPNNSAGATAITIHVATSGHSSANVREYSGLGTSSILDAATSFLGSSGFAAMSTPTATASQTDLAVAFCVTGQSVAAHFAVAGNWTNLTDFTNVADITDTAAADILNGKKSSFTGNFSGDIHNYECAETLYKSAVPETPPTGNLDAFWIGNPSATDGTTLTPAILNASSKGAFTGKWVYAGSELTVCTSGYVGLISQLTVNGVSYTQPSGSQGICDNLAAADFAQLNLPTAQPQLDVYFTLTTPASIPTSDTLSAVEISGGGSADFIASSILGSTGGADAGKFVLECKSGDSTSSSVASASTKYGIWLEYVAGVTHSMKVWTSPDSSPSLLLTQTCPATGTNNANFIAYGQSHASPQTGTIVLNNLQYSFTAIGP